MGKKENLVVGIRKSDGWVHCFTCGESCSLEQMISRCFGVDDLGQYGNRWLKNSFLTGFNQERHININIDRKRITDDCRNKYVDEKELEQYRFYHPYMYERKLTDDVIDLFDIRI